MQPQWVVPGYDVTGLLGFGGTGEVWRAIRQADGAPVALKRLRPPDPAAAARLRRLVAAVSSLRHPHLVALHDLLDLDPPSGAAVLVTDYAPGGSLAALLAGRGSLAAGEVVTLVAPLADALAALHARGLRHGAVTADNVVLAADGRPLLTDAGLADAVGDPPSGGPEGDVRALAALARAALGDGAAPDALRRALDEAVGPTPPDAAALASRLLTAAAAEPVRRFAVAPAARAGAAAPRQQRGDRREALRWLRRTAVAVAAVAVAVAAGIAWGRHGGEPAAALPPRAVPAGTRAAASGEPRVSWTGVMRRLEARRMAAYRRGDPVELRTVYATGAAIGERDVARLAHLVGMRLQVRGLSARVLAVHLLAATSSTAQLRVVDALSSALITDAHGDRVAVTAARAPRAFDVTLRRERGVWRIYRLRPAGQRSSAPSAASTSS